MRRIRPHEVLAALGRLGPGRFVATDVATEAATSPATARRCLDELVGLGLVTAERERHELYGMTRTVYAVKAEGGA